MQNQPKKKLLDQVRDVIRLKHYSIRTERAYVDWIRRFILFHDKRHPREMGSAEIEAFLTHLAVERQVAASTQNQALNALVFLYRQVLRKDLDGPIQPVRAKRPKRLPTVLTKQEALTVIDHLSGTYQLMTMIFYGSGLRLMECLRLRVKDVDFAQRQIVVRDGKGMWSASTPTPTASGFGNTSFPPSGSRSIRARARCAVTTWIQEEWRGSLKQWLDRQASPSTSRRTSSAIPSPPTCWRMATTFAPYRNSSATKTSKPP